MHSDKSLNPDGFNSGFYKNYWDVVGGDVVWVVRQFLMTGEFPDQLSDTNICLILKKSKPENMGDLRPISLCNVIYKVVSKVLANRMKMVLTNLISDMQSAFLPGRLITDNIMISYEIMNYWKKNSGKNGFMAIKLGTSKAYDRVEWGFLQAVMKKMGYKEHIINLVMKCMRSVSNKIVSGGHEMGPIIPRRGLHQGDPLSLYLFILCAEDFSMLIKDDRIRGCKIARGAPTISHMLFCRW